MQTYVRPESGGSLQPCTRHYKAGNQSLRWQWNSGSPLIRDGLAVDMRQTPGAGVEGWIYLEKPLPGRLTFRLGTKSALAAGTPAYQFRFGLDFTGWRMFRVSLKRDCAQVSGSPQVLEPGCPHPGSEEEEDEKVKNGTRASRLQKEGSGLIETMEIHPPESVPAGCLWLDALVIGAGVSSQRSADFQIPEHAGDLGGWCEHWPLHYSRQSPSLPLPETVTEAQQRDFATIRARYEKWLLGDKPDVTHPLGCSSSGGGTPPSRSSIHCSPESTTGAGAPRLQNGLQDRQDSETNPVLCAGAEQFQAYIRRGWTVLKALGIVRDDQGCIIGPGLVKTFDIPNSFKNVFYDILMPIVFDWKVNGNAAARETALELFDYIHDQGWAEGNALGDLWLLALGFAPYCHAVVLMRDELRETGRLEHAVRAAFWYQTFGKTFTRFDEAYVETNADALRSILFTSLAMILAMDDTPQKVQYMNGWLAWYNDALRISPRFTGLIKPDGLGFHHQAVYAGAYATCAYEFCSLMAWLLHGTGFAAAPESVANLKHALLTQDILTNKYDIPYATMGRMPRPGIRILSAYAYLALAMEGQPPATAYQRRLQGKSPDVAAPAKAWQGSSPDVAAPDKAWQGSSPDVAAPDKAWQGSSPDVAAPDKAWQGSSPDVAAPDKAWQGSLPDVAAPDKAWPDPDLAGIFMRLWDPHCAYLGAGDKGTNYLPQVLSVDLDAQQGKFLFYQTPGRLQILQELADRKLPAAPPPQGFWSKPWGALAIHRRDDWLVSVKGWSQYVWDFEMHPKCWAPVEENVFARYLSYGTLQPIMCGNPPNPVASGWNLAQGWDWCRWPGATTPHLTLNELYDPKTSWANRFFSAASFVGAVSCEGRNGMFALKLHEHYYDPTFRAYKTYFFFENAIICLGSNIETRDAAHRTETTLFQCWMPEEGMPVHINGERVVAFPHEFSGEAGKPLTLVDPYGNGYYLPDGGAVRLRRSVQRSRDAWNRGDTEGAFSTCWLDHGQPPREDGYGEVRYHYVMLMRPSAEALAAFAKAPPYRVLQQNHQAHILEHIGQKTMAYALFETDWIIPHGIVRKTDTPVMVMVKETGDGLILSLADPDLRLPKRRNMGYLDDEANATPSRPSVVRVELRGDWQMAADVPGIAVEESHNGVTALRFACRDGATREVVLNRKGK